LAHVVTVAGVWKRYRLRPRSLRELAGDLWNNHNKGRGKREGGRGRGLEDLWALQDVSLEVTPGTTLGLVGANGSGKSTLLKVIAGMMPATRGSISVSGRLAYLGYLGAGFHGDLTGRENVALEGALLGFGRREVRAKLPQILAFAELEPFADVPVKFYSAGMTLRLGFAIAAHVEPEILLIDEAFAVGDTAFRDRCLERILQFKRDGVTMVLVSHERYLVEQLCDDAIVLHDGRVVTRARPEVAFDSYHQTLDAGDAGRLVPHMEGDPLRAPLVIEDVQLIGSGSGDPPVFPVDAPLVVRIRARATRDVTGATVGVQIARDWHVLHGTRSNRQGIEVSARAGETVTLEVGYRRLSLSRGSYAVHVLVHEHRLAEEPALTLKRAARFGVTHGEAEGVGIVRLEHVWRRVDD
jgi:ABC-2 type transport system ATP-binding protein